MINRKPYSLKKSERLKSRKQIDFLFQSGRKITQFPFRLLYRTEPGSGEIKAGVTVSSKIFSRAVDRNRIKRLLRETYRQYKNELRITGYKNRISIHLFVIYTGKEILSFTEIFAQFRQVMDKLIKSINEKPFANS
jgi:ribonuclease P protein component